MHRWRSGEPHTRWICPGGLIRTPQEVARQSLHNSPSIRGKCRHGGNRGIELDPALIVEDNTATQQRIARLLGRAISDGPRIATADCIAAAKAQIAQKVPALALIDIGLPDDSGIELIG